MSLAAQPDTAVTAARPGWWSRSRVWVALAGVGLLLIGIALFLRGLERPAEWVIPADEIAHEAGLAWVVEVRDRVGRPWQARGPNAYDPFRSDLLVFEDGRLLGPPRSDPGGMATSGGGAYGHWGRKLWFSTSDGSDPRGNGREYRVSFTAVIDRKLLSRLANAGSVLLAAGLLGVLWGARGVIAPGLSDLARALWRRLPDAILAAMIPAALAALAWSFLPPLWNGSDSVIWLLWQLPWIPHHAPAYPLMMALLERVTGNDPAGMLYGAMLIQHVLQVLGVVWVATAVRGPGRILLVSAAASLGTAYGLFSHGLFTEGLANPLLLLFIGALLRLWRDGPTRGVLLALALTLLLASLTRYLLIVFAGMPVLFLLLLVLFKHRLRAGWRAVGLAMALAVGVVGANSAINAWLSLLLDAQTAPVLGRPAVYRIQEAYTLVPPEERAAWMAALQARTDDPDVRTALPLMATVENPWTGPRDALALVPSLYARHPDVLMTTGFRAFLFWPDAAVWSQWLAELGRAVFGPEPLGYQPGQVRRLLQESAASIDAVFPRDARAVAAVAATGTGADNPAMAAQYLALAEQTWAQLADLAPAVSPPHRTVLLGLSLALLLAALWRGRDPGLASLLLTLWGGALAYVIALTLITVVLPRYLAPVDLLLWLSNAFAVLALTVGRKTGQDRA
jgi:hypothetical protein